MSASTWVTRAREPVEVALGDLAPRRGVHLVEGLLLALRRGHLLLHALQPGLHLLAALGPAAEDAEQRRDVRRADQDGQHERAGRDQHRGPDPGVILLDVGHDRLDLDAHRQEHRPLEDELDRAPVLRVRQPVLRREIPRRTDPGDQAGDDGGDETGGPEHSAGTEAMNGTVNEMTVLTVGSVTRLRTTRLSQPTTPADDDRDDDRVRERADRAPERERRGRRDDRGAEQHERGRVVEQALAVEDRHDPLGHRRLLDDRRGHGVGRADDRTEGDTPREPESRNDEHEEQAEHAARCRRRGAPTGR